MTGLDVKGISKVYGAKTVVDTVSFQASAGQILGILGPNGAGKTTAIRMIMGMTVPDQGDIVFVRDQQRQAGLARQNIGYLPEERGLYKEARVMEILLFLAGLKDVARPTARARALEWLEKFGLSQNVHSKIEQLSKGMAQKVQFIACVLHEPELIILDEPFSGLDPVSQDIFKEEIRRLAAAGSTILLSSHQMNIVEELCDQIFLIHQGREVAYGSLDQIKEQYGHYQVTVSSAESIEPLVSSPLVSEYKQLSRTRWLLSLGDDVTPAQFLSRIPEDAAVSELSVARPSLHNIFVRIAKGGLPDEGDLEDRPMGNHAESEE